MQYLFAVIARCIEIFFELRWLPAIGKACYF